MEEVPFKKAIPQAVLKASAANRTLDEKHLCVIRIQTSKKMLAKMGMWKNVCPVYESM